MFDRVKTFQRDKNDINRKSKFLLVHSDRGMLRPLNENALAASEQGYRLIIGRHVPKMPRR